MSNYIEIEIENISSTQREILIAQLSEIGFEGFEEGEDFLSAYIEQEALNEINLKNILSSLHLTYSKNLIEQKNWNEEWEKNFEPVVIDDFATIRAQFHNPVKTVQHEIIITPKMSFGTGTGILAILAEKLGAAKIIAIDNDEWSISNAKENIEKNNCKNIQLYLS